LTRLDSETRRRKRDIISITRPQRKQEANTTNALVRGARRGAEVSVRRTDKRELAGPIPFND